MPRNATGSSCPHHQIKQRQWKVHSSILLVFLLAIVTMVLPANTVFGPDDVRSSGRHAPSEWAPEISPMGAIARGDVPIPVPPVGIHAMRPRLAAPSIFGLQGSDILVHSPTAPDFQSENTVAKNGNFIVAGYNDIRGFWLPDVSVSGYSYSSDDGASWTDGGQMPTFGGDKVYGDPDVKTWTDPNTSQVYFFFASLYSDTLGQSSLCINVSTDGGATWSLPRDVTTAKNGTDFPDKEFMGVDPETGRIFISWTNFGAETDMRVTYSDDFGMTWTGLNVFTPSGQGSVPRADGSSNNVYVGWRRTWDIQFVRSTDNGLTWGSPAAIVGGLANPMNPYGSDRIHGFIGMDVDNTNGNVYIAYASRNMAPDFADIYFIRSTDGGVTWSSPVAINANPGNDRAQFFAWLSVDQTDGRVDVIWYDQINGSGTSDLTDVFHTHSYDGGLTWACPTPITDKPFHAEYGNRTSQPNIGDYIQCVSENGKLYSTFAKTDEPSYLTFAPDTYFDRSDGTVPDAPISFVSSAFTDAGCTSANGYAEAAETIDLTVTIENYSTCLSSITGILGTVTTSTPGVTITNAAQTFGNLSAVGSTASNANPFVLDLDPGFASGTDIELLLTVGSSAGPALVPFSIPTGAPVQTTLLAENFDGVVAPLLPAGWSTALLVGTNNPWVTSMTFFASGANSVFCADVSVMSHNRLLSPPIVIPGNADLVDVTFDVTHNIEDDTERKAWDGAVLKIEINDASTTVKFAGAFASLFEPFYPWQMNRASGDDQPLQDLSCWSSDVTPNFSSVHLQFPGLAGTTIRLFFEMGTDIAIGTPTGMFIDNIVVKSIEKPSVCTDPPTAIAVPSPLVFTSVPGHETTCDTIAIVNEGPTPLILSSISGCTMPPFSIDTTMTAHSIPPYDSTRMVVCVTPTENGQFNCAINVESNAINGPTVIPVSVPVVTAIGTTAPMPFEILGVAPNPFNPSTSVRFSLPRAMPVTAEVWSVNGSRIAVLAAEKPFTAGLNEIRWDGRNANGHDVASGIYFVRVTTSLGQRVTRAVLLK